MLFWRYALCASIAAALLAACGGSAFNSSIPSASGIDTLAHHLTFHYTGAKQYFKVPRGVKALTVVVLGAAGGSESGAAGGLGGRVHAIVPVTPGDVWRRLVLRRAQRHRRAPLARLERCDGRRLGRL